MTKDDKVRMPSGMAGLMRYGDEAKDQIKIKPKYVILTCIAVVMIELILGVFA